MMPETLATQPLLEISGLTLGYGGTLSSPAIRAVTDVTFQVLPGEFVGIIGPNGSGKSTLLKGILGMLPVLDGAIRFNGLVINQQQFRKSIGYVPQKSKNVLHFPALVREVVLMGLYAQIGWLHYPQKKHRTKVREALRLVGMDDFSERPIGSLSGGQQQRVMIARALVAEPDLFILDEPTASIDVTAQNMILELLKQLNQQRQITILMVAHDLNEIVPFCHKLLLLGGVQAKFGTPYEVLTKENLKAIYGNRIYVHDHAGHPHILVGDFNE
jgi:ABC-type Mn2+/Zn2+ transport system ATPase subunit